MLEVTKEFRDVHSKVIRKKGQKFKPETALREKELLKGGCVKKVK